MEGEVTYIHIIFNHQVRYTFSFIFSNLMNRKLLIVQICVKWNSLIHLYIVYCIFVVRGIDVDVRDEKKRTIYENTDYK